MAKIEHLSPSTVQSYRNCGKQLYLNKILGIDNPQKYAMTIYGSAMHKAIERLYKEKLSKKDFKKAFTEEFSNTCGVITAWKTDSETHLLTQGIAACEDFYKNVYGKYEVEEVEQEFTITRGDKELPILCYADAITKDGTIIDYKFGRGLSGMADSKSYSCNMATYAWAYEQATGKLPKKIVFIKEKWARHMDKELHQNVYTHKEFVIDEMPVMASTVDFYKDVYDNVEAGIKANVWLPAPDESFFCKSCGYRIRGYCNKEVR